ncbi:MAG: hypothetical protein WC882_02315 [Candidatus Gracilibacteria bacterium]
MISVWKNTKESFDRFLSRFDHAVQRSRVVRVLRERRYRKKPLTRRLQRQAALKREFYRAKREKMKFY